MLNANQPSKRELQSFPIWIQVSIAFLFVFVIVASRMLLADMANWKPVASVALFAGFLFGRSYLPMLVILGGMLLSDFFLGSYSWQVAIAVYSCLMLPILFGKCLGRIQSKASIRFVVGWLASVLGGSTLFFLVTNFAYWRFTGIYSQDLSGLTECLANAIPFFRNTLSSDLFFSGIFFGVYAIAASLFFKPASVTTPTGDLTG